MPAQAQELGGAERGWRLAERWCVNGHAPGSQPRANATGVPDFRAIAADRVVTPPGAAGVPANPHEHMPGLPLSNNAIDGLIAYILSSRGGQAGTGLDFAFLP